MSRSKSSKKKSNLKHVYILILVLALLAGGYYYIEKLEREIPQGYTPVPVTNENSNDKYTFLENTDSIKYQAIVIYKQDVSINDIAKTFYNNDLFWPYIYIENKELILNPLNIKKDIVLKIPRLSSILSDPDDSINIKRAKFLADSILSNPTMNEQAY